MKKILIILFVFLSMFITSCEDKEVEELRVVSVTSIENNYDADGNLYKSSKTDCILEYDKNDNLIKETTVKYDSKNNIESTYIIHNEYNFDNLLIKKTEGYYSDNTMIEGTIIWYEYDSNNNLIKKRNEDYELGVTNSYLITLYLYDELGNIAKVSYTSYNLDGSIKKDYGFSEDIYEYDYDNKILKHTHLFHYPEKDFIQTINISFYVYLDNGNIQIKQYTGSVNEFFMLIIKDSNGNTIHESYYRDTNLLQETINTYDDKGNHLSYTYIEYGNDSIYKKEITTYEYDLSGNITKEIYGYYIEDEFIKRKEVLYSYFQ